jgi:hypothetical protein
MHDLRLATKTISIEVDAYEMWVRERKDPNESFSPIGNRDPHMAHWHHIAVRRQRSASLR